MKPLSQRARSIVERANERERLGDVDRERMRRKLMARLAVAGAVTAAAGSATKAAASAASGSAAGGTTAVGVSGGAAGGAAAGGALAGKAAAAGAGIGLSLKLGLGVLVVAGAAGGGLALRGSLGHSDPASASTAMPAAPVADAPPVTATTSGAVSAPGLFSHPITETPVDSPPPVASVRRTVRSAPGATNVARTEVAPDADQLREETAALSLARSSLSEGRAAEALSELREQETRFPHGRLAPERRALTAMALCALGRVDEGREVARPFLGQAGASPLADKLNRACAR